MDDNTTCYGSYNCDILHNEIRPLPPKRLMLAALLFSSSFLNFIFYIYAIGFVIALGLEQWLKFRPLSPEETMNERNVFIVQSNRKYLWRQTWVVNINWFACNVGLYFVSRSMQTPVDTFWDGAF